MTKNEVAEEIKIYVEEAPGNAQKVQVILLGDGGWITTNSWMIEDDSESE